MIEKNLGTIDRVIRLAVALVLIYLAAVVVKGLWIVVLAVLAGFVIHAVVDGY